MNEVPKSESERYFHHTDFDVAQLPNCPVRGCGSHLSAAPYRRGKTHWLPYCVEHGLRLHLGSGRPTFVFYNGPDRGDGIRARLRNFVIEKEHVRQHVLDSAKKAETHRLGYELSEDALSWNVFVGLAKAGTLREVMCWLAGRVIEGEPELYLWGCPWEGGGIFGPLAEARQAIEPPNLRFPTEPDIMLVVPRRFIMCIEAKFTSGNTLALPVAVTKEGEKPKDKPGLLERYFHSNALWSQRATVINPDLIGPDFHGQLFRNIVFAAAMAERWGADWQVVSLTRRPHQAVQGDRRDRYADFGDPTPKVCCYLKGDHSCRFVWRTWEHLYRNVLSTKRELAEVAGYVQGKSAYLKPAFAL